MLLDLGSIAYCGTARKMRIGGGCSRASSVVRFHETRGTSAHGSTGTASASLRKPGRLHLFSGTEDCRMSHLVVALIVFMVVLGSALACSYLRDVLPQHHLSDESISMVKLTTGLLATLAALVLGLLISSAKGSFDTTNGELVHSAVNIVRLDRVLARYGPETRDIRAQLKHITAASIALLADGDA